MEHKTADGVTITDGLLFWNNNLDLCRVVLRPEGERDSANFEGWYDNMLIRTWDNKVPNGTEGVQGSIMNGERMATQFNGRSAQKAFEEVQRAHTDASDRTEG